MLTNYPEYLLLCRMYVGSDRLQLLIVCLLSPNFGASNNSSKSKKSFNILRNCIIVLLVIIRFHFDLLLHRPVSFANFSPRLSHIMPCSSVCSVFCCCAEFSFLRKYAPSVSQKNAPNKAIKSTHKTQRTTTASVRGRVTSPRKNKTQHKK